ncbi:MAG: dependent protein [Candidatus Hydrogenedentes bacterium]|nr:dependent protein [Candidatus Hydrogenedentota bacterium]
MSSIELKIQNNLAEVRRRIQAAAERAGRTPDTVRLVAVTKTVGVEEARIIHDLGVQDLGENRVHVAQDKIERLDRPARWHMIGNCQRRKAREVVALFDCVDAVDRVKLAEALQRRCEERDKTLRILIEVNVSGEDAKQGIAPGEIAAVLRQVKQFDRLTVDGLMTMAPFVDDPEQARPVFAGLRALAQDLGLPELSMGMTNDYEVAIEEGATQVRIGSALFA